MELPSLEQVLAGDPRIHFSKSFKHVNHYQIADKRGAAYDSRPGDPDTPFVRLVSQIWTPD